MSVRYVSSVRQVVLPHGAIVFCDRHVASMAKKLDGQAIVVTGGEQVKTWSCIERWTKKIVGRHLNRDLSLVAMGGGTIGDATGFLASILWRGVGLVHIPTTLLAMVDSSHGGKTALNAHFAKNQWGTFYPASTTWIVRSLFDRQPDQQKLEGAVEMFKAALIGDVKLHQAFVRRGLLKSVSWNSLKQSISIKRNIVKEDPRDETGRRAVLNLGHTLGHALEKSTGLPHGLAVAWGLAAMSVVSESFGFKHSKQVLSVLQPALMQSFVRPNTPLLRRLMSVDKKTQRKGLQSVVLSDVCCPQLTTQVEVLDWVEALIEVQRRLV